MVDAAAGLGVARWRGDLRWESAECGRAFGVFRGRVGEFRVCSCVPSLTFPFRASAIHSVPAASLMSQETSKPESIKTFETTCPVLDFCHLPSGSSTQKLLVSLDPAWRQRIDGGLAYFPPRPTVIAKSNRKRAKQALVEAEKAESEETKPAAEPVVPEAFAEEQLTEMARDVFIVLELGVDGGFSDVTAAHRGFVQGIQGELQKGTSRHVSLRI